MSQRETWVHSEETCEGCRVFAGECHAPVGDGSAWLCWICAHYVTHHDHPVGPLPDEACGCTKEMIYPAHVLAKRTMADDRLSPPLATEPDVAPPSALPAFLAKMSAKAFERSMAISRGMRRARVTRVQSHRARKDTSGN